MSRSLARIAACLALTSASLMLPEKAEAKFVFPYNHPDLKWYSIETEHFVVHYPVSRRSAEQGNEHFLTTEWSARMSARVAEEMWEPMCAEFNYYLKEKIHIVMLNQSDELEGFTIPNWDWIEISANPGGTFYRSRGRMEWFSDVLVHEFAHVVSLKANGVLAEGVQGVLIGGLYQDGIHDVDTGAELFIGDSDSVFWTEGGAEYWSDDIGYNYWTASRDMNIRMTVLEDRLLRYEEWHTRAGKWGWGDSERYYQQGYSFGQYLRQRFGDQTYARFAIENGRRGWRPAWETVVEEVTGVDAHTLYNDWVEYVQKVYGDQYDQVKARGEAVGRELLSTSPLDWEYTDPDGRDKWQGREKRRWPSKEKYKWDWQRERAREKTGRYFSYPRVNADGSMIGYNSGFSLNLRQGKVSALPTLSRLSQTDEAADEQTTLLSTATPIYFGDAWDFIPGRDAVVVTGTEHIQPSPVAGVTGLRLETDGYDWKQLWVYDLPTTDKGPKDKKVATRQHKQVLGKHEVLPKGSARPIPNTLRGVDPAVSPDGQRVAYFEYTDGTLNLVNIALDGSDKRYITEFKDGTWMQQVDWSPDGSQLIFAMFHNYQQNLYVVNADGTGLRPITQDSWEEQDALWHSDGRIYFSADPGGIFNIYSMQPDGTDIRQLTNVIGGAESPAITPEGDLAYIYYTSFGWKLYGLPRDEFLYASADSQFNTQVDQAKAAEDLAYSEDLSSFAALTKPYNPAKPSNLMAPTGVPMFRIENDSQTNLGLQAGGQIFLQDYVEKNGLFLYGLFGEDILFLGQYFNQSWIPTFNLTGYHYEVKYSPAFLLDEDEDASTTDDQTINEFRQAQYANILSAAVTYPWNNNLFTAVYARGLDYGFKTTSDTAFTPYLQEIEAGVQLNFVNNNALAADYRPNTFTGRNIDLTYNHAWTDVVYAPYGGVAVDDGMLLDNYEYNKVELRWTENIRVPTFWGIPFMKTAAEREHVIQVDTLFGYVDRNVDYNDEFRAGGQHPYFWGSGTLRPNTQFAGYPAYSLSGETMAIVNLAYRFPLARYLQRKVGPIFVNALYAQVGGTAGNLWSYRVPDDPDATYPSRYDDRIARDPSDVHREIPFVDIAHKNGNYLLTDASAELRMESTMFHGFTWNSFVRVAYGFNEVHGYGDVNGDGVQDTNENAVGDELSNETEKPGPRIYIGLGTGW